MTHHEKYPDQGIIVRDTVPGTKGMPDPQGLLHIAAHVIEIHGEKPVSTPYSELFQSHVVAVMRGEINVEDMPHNADAVRAPDSIPYEYAIRTGKGTPLPHGGVQNNSY